MQQGDRKGAGGTLRGYLNRGSMDTNKEASTHKCIGDESSLTSNQNLYKKPLPSLVTPIDRQQGSLSTHSENGPIYERDTNQFGQRDLDALNVQTNHSDCRVHSLKTKRGGRLPIEERGGLERMDAEQEPVKKDLKLMENSKDRSVCIKNFTPVL